jgi:tetratricopeptide (TPR) repeat protein
MGTVFLAEDTRLGRLVALKTVSGADADTASAREQLLREARAAAALSHPNIAGVHDVLDADGQVVIVFEYIEGETLATRLQKGRLPIDTAIAIALQLTEALRAAHERGIIHRDLKPANVAIAPDGVVKVLDFGIARTVPREPPDTDVRTTASFTGTIGYAAPEQCLGQRADARADIFSLGVVLYEMLTGERPFPGREATTVVRAMLEGEAPRVSTVVADVPPHLEDLLARALARDPARRPQTAGEFREGLLAHLPTGTVVVPRRGTRRARAVVALALLVGALGIGVLVSSLRSGPPGSRGVRAPVIAVLPLANASGDASKDYLALGVADNLITRLAALKSVTVLSRSAVADARRRKADIRGLATELDATYLVDGSVQQAGDQLRINLNLVREDSSVAWADTVEGSFERIFELQTRLASVLAEALEVQLSAADRASLAQQPTTSADALAAYWRGRVLLDRRDVAGNLEAALASFAEATRLDPSYAAAHAAQGEALWSRYVESRRPEDARAATEAGTTALRLDPNSAEVRYTLAVTLAGSGQLTAALEEMQRALAIRPTFEDARVQLGRVLARLGRIDEALAEFRAVSALRPNNAAPYTAMGTSLYEAGRFAEAAAAFERVTALQPDNVVAHQQAGVAFQAHGDEDRALAWYGKALAIRPYAQAYSNIGAIHHQRGDYDKAVDAYQRAIEIRPNARETHRNLGDAYTKMGRTAEAERAYRRAIALTQEDLRVNPRDARSLASLAVYLQKVGEGRQASDRLAEALLVGANDFEVLRRSAQVHALAGRADEALDALEAALGLGFRREIARTEDEFASVRQHPRFKALTSQP